MRQRGVAVVMRHGKVLLVRDRGKHSFSLPGGALKKGEPTVSGAARELYEELGLTAPKVTRLRNCDFRGVVSLHEVCLVEASGEPHLRGHELDKFMWWDMKTRVPIYSHVKNILKRTRDDQHWV
jgi:8-oxo-dGTP pyrophosphatase MutT (NUDIX family)